MGKVISPAYDPAAGVWFTDDGVEATTIRELMSITGCEVLGFRASNMPPIKLPSSDQPVKRTMQAIRPSGIAFRMPSTPIPRVPVVIKKDRFKWTPELKQMVRELKKEGFSATQIGDRIGVSRNSIIGILDRAK